MVQQTPAKATLGIVPKTIAVGKAIQSPMESATIVSSWVFVYHHELYSDRLVSVEICFKHMVGLHLSLG